MMSLEKIPMKVVEKYEKLLDCHPVHGERKAFPTDAYAFREEIYSLLGGNFFELDVEDIGDDVSCSPEEWALFRADESLLVELLANLTPAEEICIRMKNGLLGRGGVVFSKNVWNNYRWSRINKYRIDLMVKDTNFYGREFSLNEIAKVLAVSVGRVRQIEMEAMMKLRSIMRK